MADADLTLAILTNIREDIRSVKADLKADINSVKSEVSALRTETMSRFDAVDTRFDGVDSRLGLIEHTLHGQGVQLHTAVRFVGDVRTRHDRELAELRERIERLESK